MDTKQKLKKKGVIKAERGGCRLLQRGHVTHLINRIPTTY